MCQIRLTLIIEFYVTDIDIPDYFGYGSPSLNGHAEITEEEQTLIQTGRYSCYNKKNIGSASRTLFL